MTLRSQASLEPGRCSSERPLRFAHIPMTELVPSEAMQSAKRQGCRDGSDAISALEKPQRGGGGRGRSTVVL